MTVLGGGGEVTPAGLPIAAALLGRGTGNVDPAVVVLAPGARSDPPDAGPAVALLAGASDVGAVVPRVLGPDGTLAEAGAQLEAGGGLRSCGRGESPRRSEYRFRRPVDGSRYGCFAVRGALIAGLAIDPGCDDAGEVAAAVLRQVRQGGHAVVYEPAWSVTVPVGRAAEAAGPEAGPYRPPVGAAGPAERILVVCADLSIRPSPWSDGGVEALIAALDADRRPGRVSVACAEARGNEDAAARLRARGVEVETGPADWGGWFHRRAYRFSHLIVTDGGVASGLAGPALRTQPQAAKVLWTHALPFRAVEAMVPVTPLRERPGHEYVRATVEAKTAEMVRQFDRVWSASPADQQHLSGLLGCPVPLVTRPVSPPEGRDDGHGERWGMAVLAAPGADMVAGHEDAAATAVEEIFARLAPRLPDARLVVVADRPSPHLARLVERAGVELVPPGPDGGIRVLARARVVLAPYRHGLGGTAALWAAFSAGTPVLTTGHAGRAFSLGDLAPQACFAEPLDLVEPAWRLHHDGVAWHRYRAALDSIVADRHSRRRFQEVLRHHLLELGILPAAESGGGTPATLRLPEPPETGAWRPAEPWRLSRPALRPTDRPGRVPASIPEGVDEGEGYRMWCRSRGPTPAALGRLAAEVAALGYRPRISVIMPVYNTDADVLEAALASVRNQLYDNWELCIADDGSTRAETKAVLARAAGDPRVRVSYLPGQSGISGASNAAVALASGDYLTLLDHDDELKPHALAQVVRWLNADPSLDVIYSDEDKLNEAGELVSPFFKPDWSPNLLLATNYVCHLLVVRKSLMDKVGGFRSGFDGSQDHDLVLRLTELTDRIGHIPEPLYSWRMVPGSAAAVPDAKPYAFEAAKKALREALARRGQEGLVVDGDITGVYRTRYAVPGRPRVAIIIPTRDRVDLLRTCIDSIRTISSYDNYEIVVIDNESRERATVEYLASFSGRVIRYPAMFNYARMLNLAAHLVECDALLFLNNDTEVRAADWIDALLEHGMRPEVGAVGGRLYLPDGRPQHEGIIVGAMGTATNVDHAGFWGLGEMTRDASAVTGACTMIRPGVYWEVGGNDERLRVAYNDVDICLRIHQAGYQVVYTPYAKLLHLEGASRAGYEHVDDKVWFSARWRQDEEPDPYYNPNFDRHRLFRLAL